MKLKALHLRKLRYWTIQKGELGTAHTNRDGNEVDYRPLDYIQGRVKGLIMEPSIFPMYPMNLMIIRNYTKSH